jgi:hypothetical protein
MRIDIDKLTEAELIDLNHRVVERLRLLKQMRAHVAMMEFKIGDRVAFQADHRGYVEGMLTRYNRKSVTVITDDGHRWNVSPGLKGTSVRLRRIGGPGGSRSWEVLMSLMLRRALAPCAG